MNEAIIAVFFLLMSSALLVITIGMLIMTIEDMREAKHRRKIETLRAEHRHSEL